MRAAFAVRPLSVRLLAGSCARAMLPLFGQLMRKEFAMQSPRFAGILSPMVTPFTADEELDEDALRAETRVMLEAGVHGVCVCGSTGEGHVLSIEESCRVTAIVREEVRGRVPVIAGIIRDSTRDVVRYGQALREVGADALQITPVHYLF